MKTRKLIPLFLIVFLLIVPVYASFYDNMENFALNWNAWSGNGGFMGKTAAQAHSGTFSALVSTTGIQYAYATNAIITEANGSYHLSVYVWIDSSVAANYLTLFETYNHTGANGKVSAQLVSNATGYYVTNRNNTLNYPMFLISNNTWEHIEAFYNYTTGYVHYYLDNATENNVTAFSTGGIDRLSFGDFQSSGTDGNGKVYFDDFLIDTAIDTGSGSSLPPPSSGTTPAGIDLTLLPSRLAAVLGIDAFTAGILISCFVVMFFLLPTIIYTNNMYAILTMCILGMTLCVALTWLPFWTLFVIVLLIALLFAGSARDWITGKGR